MVKGRLDNAMGQIEVKPDVIASYAGSVAVECFGIVGMAAVSMKDGLVKILRRDSMRKGISVTVTPDNLIENVKYKVEAFTGMEIEKIKIYVEGVRSID